MRIEMKKEKESTNIDIVDVGSNLQSAKHISATIPLVIGFILGIVIPFGMLVAFKDGCTETLLVKGQVPIEILHYRPILMVACVLIMCLFLLGLYALHCYFIHCIVREDGKIMSVRRDILLGVTELSEKLGVQETKMNRKDETSIDIHYYYKDGQDTSSKNPTKSSDKGNSCSAQGYVKSNAPTMTENTLSSYC